MKNILLNGALVNELLTVLDTFEIESSIDIIKNNKKVTLVDQRIVTDKKTSKTYLVFKEPGEEKDTKIDLLNIIEFLANGLYMALPGENMEKIEFITSYLNTMPKLKKGTEPEIKLTEPKKKKKNATTTATPTTTTTASNEVKNIILSNDDIIEKINKLMKLEEGKEFIKKMAGSENESIFNSIDKMMKTSLGQKFIKKMAHKYMNELEEKIKSCM